MHNRPPAVSDRQMKHRSRGGRKAALVIARGILALCFVVTAVTGCAEKPGGVRSPNIPPDTYITSGPAEDSMTSYRAQIFWYGSDADGDVVLFEIAVVRDARRGEPLDPDTLDWRATSNSESTFVVAADSCCYGGPGRHDPQYAGTHWGVLVRSVDNDGAVDETPAGRFFLAASLIPRVEFVVPFFSHGLQIVGAHPIFAWKGNDPDGEDDWLEYKYLLIPKKMKDVLWGGGLPPFDHEGRGDAPFMSPDVGTWSEWVPADCTYVRDIDLSTYVIGRPQEDTVYAYVTARDQSGGVLPIGLFDLYNWNNNVRRVRVIRQSGGVKVVIDGGGMGVVEDYHCSGGGEPPAVFAGTPLRFVFYGVEDIGLGRFTEAYRYYFDDYDGPLSGWDFWTGVAPMRDPAASPQWKETYPLDGRPFTPGVGPHVLGVELRDTQNDTTCAEFQFEVIPGPAGRPRNILLVDDDRNRWWQESYVPDYEEQEFDMWSRILDGYDWQEWDTGPYFTDRTPVRLVGSATTVIWTVDSAFEHAPDLLHACTNRGGFLHSYVKAGGNLIIIGMSPAYCTMFWPDGYPGYYRRMYTTDIDFGPRAGEEDGASHFMYEVFGIKRMRVLSFPSPTYACSMLPRPGYEDWPEIAVKPRGEVLYWPGFFEGPFLATELRPGDDVHPVYGVRHVENPGSPESTWVREAAYDHVAAVYVEGGEDRGWAALINLPAWWLDGDDLGGAIRTLLRMFGERPSE